MIRTLSLFTILGLLALASEARADSWKTYSSSEYGITLSVPDPDKCETGSEGDVGGVACDYGDIGVIVLAYKGAVEFGELREAARKLSKIPARHWKKQWSATGENGYRKAEAWLATGGGMAVAGLIGQNRAGSRSHVAFIVGSEKAFTRYQKQIARFVRNVRAH